MVAEGVGGVRADGHVAVHLLGVGSETQVLEVVVSRVDPEVVHPTACQRVEIRLLEEGHLSAREREHVPQRHDGSCLAERRPVHHHAAARACPPPVCDLEARTGVEEVERLCSRRQERAPEHAEVDLLRERCARGDLDEGLRGDDGGCRGAGGGEVHDAEKEQGSHGVSGCWR